MDPTSSAQLPTNISNATYVKSVREPGAASDIIVTSQPRIFKIIVIGDSNVGKTCLTFRLCGGRFPDRIETTIGVDFREKTLPVCGEDIKLQIWDTAGQERFRRSMIKHYYRNVHAVVFVYDVTKMSTFENLPHWISECNHNCVDHSALRILVGNKNDMEESRAISSSMARKFAEFHEMDFYETSAKDDHEYTRVNDIFEGIALKLQTNMVKSGSWWARSSFTADHGLTSANNVNLSHDNLTDTEPTYCSC